MRWPFRRRRPVAPAIPRDAAWLHVEITRTVEAARLAGVHRVDIADILDRFVERTRQADAICRPLA